MQTCKQRGCKFESDGTLEFCPVCNNPIDIIEKAEPVESVIPIESLEHD